MVTGTVHVYGPQQYDASPDAISGAAGGGGFTHLWADGTVYSYASFDAEPVVFQPDPLRRDPGIAPTLTVLTAPDGERTWLVQTGSDSAPTIAELVDLVEERVTRVASLEMDGDLRPVGLTSHGLVMVSSDPAPRTVLVTPDGRVSGDVEGVPVAVGWTGSAIARPDGALQLVDSTLRPSTLVPAPPSAAWVSVSGRTVIIAPASDGQCRGRRWRPVHRRTATGGEPEDDARARHRRRGHPHAFRHARAHARDVVP